MVNADDVTFTPTGGFFCPNCDAEVYHRRGDVRSSCFAHCPGQVTAEDCDDYYPGQGGTHLGQQARSGPAARRSRMALYVSCGGLAGAQATWQLELLLPESQDNYGSVVVDEALWGRMSIPLAKLEKGPIRIPMRPIAGQVHVRPEGVRDSQYIAILQEPFSGLDDRIPNIFRYSEHAGRQLTNKQQPLFWGRGYFLVHHRALALAIPSALKVWALKDQGDWRAHVIELPPDEDERVVSWIERNLDRRTESPPVSLSMVFPPIVELADDEAVVQAEGQHVVLGISGEAGAEPPDVLLIQTLGDKLHRVLLPRDLPALVSIGPLPSGRTVAYFPDEWEAEVWIQTVRQPRIEPPRPAELVFEGAGSETTLPLHCEKAGQALDEIRAGRLKLKGIRVPPRIPVRLAVGRKGSSGPDRVIEKLQPTCNEEHSAPPLEVQRGFEQDVATTLRSLLEPGDQDLLVDLGNFGRAATSQREEKRANTPALELPAEFRRTANWLILTAQQARVQGLRCVREGLNAIDVFLRTKAEQVLPSTDVELLRSIVSLGSTPVSLESQVRTLAKNLESLVAPHNSAPTPRSKLRGMYEP